MWLYWPHVCGSCCASCSSNVADRCLSGISSKKYCCSIVYCRLSPCVSFFHLPFLSLFKHFFTFSALCVYPFIFLWLLIPTVNKILHLNTNQAICMTGSQYIYIYIKKRRAKATVLFSINPPFWCKYVLCECLRGVGVHCRSQGFEHRRILLSTWRNFTGGVAWTIVYKRPA